MPKSRAVNYFVCLGIVVLLHAARLAYVPLPGGYVDASTPFVLFAALFSPGIAALPALLWCVLQLAFAPQVYYAAILVPLLAGVTKFLRLNLHLAVSAVFVAYAVLLQVSQPMPPASFVVKVVLEYLLTVVLAASIARQARQVSDGSVSAPLLWVFQESKQKSSESDSAFNDPSEDD